MPSERGDGAIDGRLSDSLPTQFKTIMTPAEQQILKYMRSVDEVGIAVIFENIPIPQKTIEGYVRRMKTMGLLSATKKGGLTENHYCITEKGLTELQIAKGGKSYVGQVALPRTVMTKVKYVPPKNYYQRNNGHHDLLSFGNLT